MKYNIKSLLFALLSLNLSVFAADELNPTMKAAAMIVPSVDFDRATAQEAVAFLNHKSKELDPAKKGVSIVLHGAGARKLITFKLKKSSLLAILREVSAQAGLEIEQFDGKILLTAKAK